MLQINHNYEKWTLKSPKRLQQVLTHARRASRETFYHPGRRPLCSGVGPRRKASRVGALAQALCFCEETRIFFSPFVVFRSVLRVDEV